MRTSPMRKRRAGAPGRALPLHRYLHYTENGTRVRFSLNANRPRNSEVGVCERYLRVLLIGHKPFEFHRLLCMLANGAPAENEEGTLLNTWLVAHRDARERCVRASHTTTTTTPEVLEQLVVDARALVTSVGKPQVCHTCSCKICVNPHHVLWGCATLNGCHTVNEGDSTHHDTLKMAGTHGQIRVA